MAVQTGFIHCDSAILDGTPVFAGSRVPVKSLFDYLAAGDSLDEFLDCFPTVSRDQAVLTVQLAKELLLDHAHSH